jgi:prophage antirepressor-like protein
MEHLIITNQELGHAYFYWEGKNGRLFLASQIMKELGYTGRANTLQNYDLQPDIDVIKFYKKNDKLIFDELVHLKCIGHRSGEVLFLTESGFWKLVIQSRKTLGIKTRHWLSSEVLPSIRKAGKYEAGQDSPLAIFTERNKQIELSKGTNSIIHKYARSSEDYQKFWNELHTMCTGLDAKGLRELYQTKGSAKEILRKHLPHIEATEAVIEDIWAKGIGLKEIGKTELHKSLAHSFNALISLGIDLKTLGK